MTLFPEGSCFIIPPRDLEAYERFSLMLLEVAVMSQQERMENYQQILDTLSAELPAEYAQLIIDAHLQLWDSQKNVQ